MQIKPSNQKPFKTLVGRILPQIKHFASLRVLFVIKHPARVLNTTYTVLTRLFQPQQGTQKISPTWIKYFPAGIAVNSGSLSGLSPLNDFQGLGSGLNGLHSGFTGINTISGLGTINGLTAINTAAGNFAINTGGTSTNGIGSVNGQHQARVNQINGFTGLNAINGIAGINGLQGINTINGIGLNGLNATFGNSVGNMGTFSGLTGFQTDSGNGNGLTGTGEGIQWSHNPIVCFSDAILTSGNAQQPSGARATTIIPEVQLPFALASRVEAPTGTSTSCTSIYSPASTNAGKTTTFAVSNQLANGIPTVQLSRQLGNDFSAPIMKFVNTPTFLPVRP